jgi:hypothetical protein
MYITMSPEVLQELNLSQCTLSQNLLAEDISDLLDRNTFLGLSIRRGTVEKIESAYALSRACDGVPDNTISTLTKLLCDRVSFINDKVLVKNLKHLSSYEICHVVGM